MAGTSDACNVTIESPKWQLRDTTLLSGPKIEDEVSESKLHEGSQPKLCELILLNRSGLVDSSPTTKWKVLAIQVDVRGVVAKKNWGWQ
jgi:hypothetical protein